LPEYDNQRLVEVLVPTAESGREIRPLPDASGIVGLG